MLDGLVAGAGADRMDGGVGHDWLWHAGSDAGVNVSLATGTGSGGHAEGDTGDCVGGHGAAAVVLGCTARRGYPYYMPRPSLRPPGSDAGAAGRVPPCAHSGRFPTGPAGAAGFVQPGALLGDRTVLCTVPSAPLSLVLSSPVRPASYLALAPRPLASSVRRL